MRNAVLLVTDDGSLAALVDQCLTAEGFRVSSADTLSDAERLIRRSPPDCVLLSLTLPDGNALDLLARTDVMDYRNPVILFSSGSDGHVIAEMRRHPLFAGFMDEPFSADSLAARFRDLVQGWRHSRREPREEAAVRPDARQSFRWQDDVAVPDAAGPTWDQILRELAIPLIGCSESISLAVERGLSVARSTVPVLIHGETGTGKDLVARLIHRASGRRGALLAQNCAGLTENLLEAELFGYVKGAFTGAIRNRRGRVRTADGGTVFLDEVADMPMPVQAKVLRLLDNGEVFPVGADEAVTVNVRVVAATNKDLKAGVKGGCFREDLYFRLKGVEIQLPPLRSRREDIPLLINHFLLGRSISAEAVGLLMEYDWPGNVRELRQTLEVAAALAPAHEVRAADLPEEIRTGSARPAAQPCDESVGLVSLKEAEREHILRVLEAVGNNKTRAARILGVHVDTLNRKLCE